MFAQPPTFHHWKCVGNTASSMALPHNQQKEAWQFGHFIPHDNSVRVQLGKVPRRAHTMAYSVKYEYLHVVAAFSLRDIHAAARAGLAGSGDEVHIHLPI